jgi:predicted nucleic acid-binding protein
MTITSTAHPSVRHRHEARLCRHGLLDRTGPQTHQSFLDGFALYQARPDRAYSLTDCIAMEAMRQESITDILTHDNHFTQEGFTTLL